MPLPPRHGERPGARERKNLPSKRGTSIVRTETSNGKYSVVVANESQKS